jgi:transposase
MSSKTSCSPRGVLALRPLTSWASIHLTHADAVVLEATSNAWLLYDQLQPLVAEGVVAHPQAVKLIAAARVKTDSRDTIKLASLLAANLIPAVWVPPQEVRELRALVTHRNRLVKPRTQAANRLHSVLQRHNLEPPPGQPFALRQQEWWLGLELPLAEKLRVQQDLRLYQTLEALIGGERSRTRSAFHLRPVGQTGSVSGAVAWAGGSLCYASPGRHWGNHPLSLGQASGGLCWLRGQCSPVRGNQSRRTHHQRRSE